jgi:hypothetical protein
MTMTPSTVNQQDNPLIPTLGPTTMTTTVPSTVDDQDYCLIPDFLDGIQALGQWVSQQPYPHQSDGLPLAPVGATTKDPNREANFSPIPFHDSLFQLFTANNFTGGMTPPPKRKSRPAVGKSTPPPKCKSRTAIGKSLHLPNARAGQQ